MRIHLPLLLVLLVFPLLTAQAHDPASPGYWYSSNGTLIRNSYGECWRTSQWSRDNALKACDPQFFVVEEKPAEPEAVSKPAAPEQPSTAPKVERFTLPLVLFDFDKAELDPHYMHDLHQLAMRIKDNRDMRLTLIGHTDSKGSNLYNMKLGLKRAQTVANHLLSLGVPASQIKAISAGENQPVADNGTEEGRARNRRVEFVLSH